MTYCAYASRACDCDAVEECTATPAEMKTKIDRLTGETAVQAPGCVTLADDGRTPILVSPATGALTGAQPAPAAPSGEVVVSWDEAGRIIAVTRQDEEGRVLSVIAEAAQPADSAMEVLRELVACKDAGHDTDYDQQRRRFNAAWDRARTLTAARQGKEQSMSIRSSGTSGSRSDE